MKYLILTNILTPYRRFFYDELYKLAKTQGDEFHVILMAETEPNRNWYYKDYKTQYSELLYGKTITINDIFIHINWHVKKTLIKYNPDLVIFVGDALTGNDATEQAVKFNDAIDVDGVILTKADADSKGGASLSIGYVIKKPILFLGMGQGYDDIMEYDAQWMLNQLFSEDEEEVSESE